MTLKDGSGYIWVFASESATVYIFRRSREGDFLPKMLKDFKGVMVTDFYSAYDGLLVCTGAGHDAVVAASRVASPGLRVRANLLNNLNVIRVVQSLPKDPTLASSLAEVRFGSTGPDKTFQSARRRWQKSPIAGESTKEAVKTTRVRECRVISGASAVNTRVHTCYPPAHTRLRVHWAPGIPHALCFRGRNISGIARAQRAARTLVFVDVIPGRECNERNLEIPLAGR